MFRRHTVTPSACMDRRTMNRSCIAPQWSTQATLGVVAPGAKQGGALSGRTSGLWLVRPLPLAWLAVSCSPRLQPMRRKGEYQSERQFSCGSFRDTSATSLWMFWAPRIEGRPLWLIGIACRRRRKLYALPSTALIGFCHCVISECKPLRIYEMSNACPRGLSLALWNNGHAPCRSQLSAEVERTLLVAFGSYPPRRVERANAFRVAGQA